MALALALVGCRGELRAAQVPAASVTIQQKSEVAQGGTGAFEVKIAPDEGAQRITLRLKCEIGTGKAVFEDDSTEKVIEQSGTVRVRGVVSSDMPGGLSFTAWRGGAEVQGAKVWFEVFPQTPQPRIFWDGRDVTGTRQTVAVGQRVELSVVLHPGVPVEKETWSMGEARNYTGGFLHTPFLGGTQPVVRRGPTTRFYWVTPGENRAVSYEVKLTTGVTATAQVTFDVEGPAAAEVQVESEKVAISQPTPSSSLLGMLEPGISFRARYDLPEGMLKNFTWVQVIESDAITIKDDGVAALRAEITAGGGSWRGTGHGVSVRHAQPDAGQSTDSPAVGHDGVFEGVARANVSAVDVGVGELDRGAAGIRGLDVRGRRGVEGRRRKANGCWSPGREARRMQRNRSRGRMFIRFGIVWCRTRRF